ncbi:hypothetical protein P691DRAFT_762903 [Macrolepiota fuliginosa MF-IS2]|uniref:Uncharacterized protein n=1 Tax=Macrolepiota fuliginosa MF-IS2 TaxID=1400762 RepID=A0A9P5X521_9AGAR|nr:hypothetical protein P691DRAFT_762903 [Macrolepiota fuliginosa MF-IS2]
MTQIYHISLQARVSLTNAEAATASPRTTSPGSEYEKLDNRYSAPQQVLTNASVHALNDRTRAQYQPLIGSGTSGVHNQSRRRQLIYGVLLGRPILRNAYFTK